MKTLSTLLALWGRIHEWLVDSLHKEPVIQSLDVCFAVIINTLLIHQWIESALVQIMVVACMAPSHYLNQHWVIFYWTLRNKLQWNCNQSLKLFIRENASENIICELVAILSRGRWVKETVQATAGDFRCHHTHVTSLQWFSMWEDKIVNDIQLKPRGCWSLWTIVCLVAVMRYVS